MAAAERASRPRSAVGMPLQVALGDHTRPGSSAAAVAQPCRRSGTAAHTPDPQRCCETGISADALIALCSRRRALSRRCGTASRHRASPLAGAQGLGCAERRLRLLRRCGAARAASRAHQQERVETRRPSACCLRPRLKHRPAPAKAGSLLSGVVAANREDRRAATRAAAVASSVCACPTITRRARLDACSSLGSQSAFCLSF